METVLLPPLVTGETLRSYTVRVQLLNSGERLRFASPGRASRLDQPDMLLPSGLNAFAGKYGKVLGRPDGLQWLLHHTVAPYFQSTMPVERLEKFQHRLLEQPHGPRRPLLPVAIAEWFAPQPRLCVHCDEESLEGRGFSIVPRSLLLPFVTRCPSHGTTIGEYSAWTPVFRGAGFSVPVIPGREEVGGTFSAASIELLKDDRTLLPELGALLQSRGMTTVGGSLRKKAVVEAVVRHAAGRYEHPELDGLMTDPQKVSRVLGPLATGRGSLHPAVALVLVGALRELEVSPQRPLQLAAVRINREFVDVAVRAAASAAAAGREAGVSTQTALLRAKAIGVPFATRAKVLTPELSAKALKMVSQGCPHAAVAKAVGLSLSTIYRICAGSSQAATAVRAKSREDAVARDVAAWEELRTASPELSKSQLRELSPALYARLYRNAREHLGSWAAPGAGGGVAVKESRGPAATRAPDGADFALARRIDDAVSAAPDADTSRRTKAKVLSNAGRHRTESIGPMANLRLLDGVESTAEFVRRRLRLVARELLERDEPLVRWRLVRAANLRVTTILASGVDVEETIRDFRRDLLREVGNE